MHREADSLTPPYTDSLPATGEHAEQSPPEELFIVGCYRSGTSLLRLMLGAHPNVFIPEETVFIPVFGRKLNHYVVDHELDIAVLVDDILEFLGKRAHWKSIPSREQILELAGPTPTYGDVVKAVIASMAGDKLRNLRYLGDKTPAYINSIFFLDNLFPSSKIINVVRDARDVAASVKKEPFWGGRTPMLVAEEWNQRILNGMLAERKLGPERVMTVRYEELVANPHDVLHGITEFLGLPYSDDMLEFYRTEAASALSRFDRHRKVTSPVSTASVGRYRKSLTPAEIETIEREAGNTLHTLGYQVDLENVLAFRPSEKFWDSVVRVFRMMSYQAVNLYKLKWR